MNAGGIFGTMYHYCIFMHPVYHFIAFTKVKLLLIVKN